jgi:hypothetical protein
VSRVVRSKRGLYPRNGGDENGGRLISWSGVFCHNPGRGDGPPGLRGTGPEASSGGRWGVTMAFRLGSSLRIPALLPQILTGEVSLSLLPISRPQWGGVWFSSSLPPLGTYSHGYLNKVPINRAKAGNVSTTSSQDLSCLF